MNQFDNVVIDPHSFSYSELQGQKREWTLRQNPRSVSASANVNALDDLILVDCTSGIVTMTLETAVGCDGRQHTIKKIDASANAVTVDGAGTETMDDATTQTLSNRYDTITIKSNGSNWDIISSHRADTLTREDALLLEDGN